MHALEKFKKMVLQSEAIPADLKRLLEMHLAGGDSPFDELGLYPIMPGEENKIFDTSYLNEADLADLDIKCNIEAIHHVARYARFVAEGDDSDFFGYWLGKSNRKIESAPIIKYDSEGQFSLLPGKTLVEAVAIMNSFDEQDDFLDYKEKFESIGIRFEVSNVEDAYDIYPEVDDDPEKLHSEIYNQQRGSRGLTPVE